jgi:4-hydroxy-tetrahydrodipicolinate synthase
MFMSQDDPGRQSLPLRVEGIVPALVTPFTSDESLDLDALAGVVDWLIAAGVHGIFAAGSQGEFFALNRDEHRAVVAQAVEAAAGRVPIYAGVGAIATREAVALAQQAQAAGAAAVTVLPPFFIRPTPAELAAHFRAVAEAVDVPVILYNQPQRTGISLSTKLVRELAEVPGIVAIKDSSASLNQTTDYLAACPEGFSVLMGNDSQIAYGLIAGVRGAIAATANVVPELCVAIYDAVTSGNIDRAVDLQRRLGHLRAAFELGTFPVVVKEAMAIAGRPVGPCRRPVGPLSGEARSQLERVVVSLRESLAVEGVR